MFAVALIHYHLNGGGVTRILEQQSAALSALGIPHLIFCGENKFAPHLPHQLVPELYFSDHYNSTISSAIIQKIEQTCSQKLAKLPIVFHFHNHSIGLNPHIGDLLEHFSKKHHLLLQIHDFAEDGREKNLLNIPSIPQLFPNAPHIHYLTINSRDAKVLTDAGATNISLLPNCYIAHQRHPVTPQKLIFYPVQLLQRKNIGELLLISLALPENYRIAIGKTPTDTTQLSDYWQSLANQLNLPIDFDVCDRLSPTANANTTFSSWYEHASHIITTSIQEGFGMVFIEPIYFQKPLFGRNLPAITADISQQGIDLDNLYHSLTIGTNNKDFGTLSNAEQAKCITQLASGELSKETVQVHFNTRQQSLENYLLDQLQNEKVQNPNLLKPWSLEQLITNLNSLLQPLLITEKTTPSPLDTNSIFDSFH